MKSRRVALISIVLVALTAEAKSPDKTKPVCFFSNPMAAGAGISSGLDGKSHVDFLAERAKPGNRSIQEAYPGYAGNVIIDYKSFNENSKKTSAVFALDLFYWDQFACIESGWDARNAAAIDKLFKLTVKRGIPLIIGNIAKQSAFPKAKVQGACAEVINQRIKERCDEVPTRCLLIDNALISKKVEDRYASTLAALEPKERNQFIREKITRDGIHPRSEASEVMADAIEEVIKDSRLECR